MVSSLQMIDMHAYTQAVVCRSQTNGRPSDCLVKRCLTLQFKGKRGSKAWVVQMLAKAGDRVGGVKIVWNVNSPLLVKNTDEQITNQFFGRKNALFCLFPLLGSSHLKDLLLDYWLFVTPKHIVSLYLSRASLCNNGKLLSTVSQVLCQSRLSAVNYVYRFLATLVALHFTPVSESVSQSVAGQSFGLA